MKSTFHLAQHDLETVSNSPGDGEVNAELTQTRGFGLPAEITFLPGTGELGADECFPPTGHRPLCARHLGL
jgi:hypothetical protein